jgi:LmbE family N-acetylglucosaminyl deacetylase
MRHLLVGLILGALAARARASDGLVVIAPHPDDELVAAGGVLWAAQQLGRNVGVVVITNGDYAGTDFGLIRQGETVAALQALGLDEDHVIFLGYPDAGLLPLWNEAPGAGNVWFSPRTGQRSTYGGRHGYGRADLHTALFGSPAPYNRPALLDDLRAALALYRPTDVFTPGDADDHPDHRASYYAVREALRDAAAADSGYCPTLHTTIVHDPVHAPFDDFWPASDVRETDFAPGNDDLWPAPAAGSGAPNRFDPSAAFTMPPSLPRTIRDWAGRTSMSVPGLMAIPDFAANVKVAALLHYAMEVSDVIWAHVKADEFFWSETVRPGLFTRNVARSAVATATAAAPGQDAAAAVDGVVDGAPASPGSEWNAATPTATLTLAWNRPVTIDRIVLFDRVSLTNWVTAAHVTLDDGTTIPVGALANDGRGNELVLAEPRIVKTVSVTIDRASGTAGLAEVEVFGVAGDGACRVDADCDDGSPCTGDTCRSGRCTHVPLADGTPCGDADACNGVEECAAGDCVRRPPPDCDDHDPCTRDRCRTPGVCMHDPVCFPVPVHGPGGCRLGVVGLPRVMCVDGDPTCDRDGRVDGVCRFDVVMCTNTGPASGRCRLDSSLAGVTVVRARDDGALGGLVTELVARLPSAGVTCVGPAPARVAVGPRRRIVRRTIGLSLLTGGGRRQRARLLLACHAAPQNAVPTPPVSPGP